MKNNAVYLAWRSEDGEKGWSPVGRLNWLDGMYTFAYTEGARRNDFVPLPDLPELDRVYQSKTLFPIFQNRLLNSKRTDYEKYLRWSGFEPTRLPDPVEILGVTEGRRTTDYFEVFPCPSPTADGTYEFRFFLHGLEWLNERAVEKLASLPADSKLLSIFDVENDYDRYAVGLRSDDQDRMIVGYLPRYLARDYYRITKDCTPENIDFRFRKLNSDAPLQFRARCSLTACWPADFEPFSGNEFAPISPKVPRSCVA